MLDADERSLIWASGGHDPAVWFHRETGKIEELPNTGMPIGVVEGATFEQGGPVLLETGDVVVIGTDGIWEAQNDRGDTFGKERFYEIVKRGGNVSAEEICSQVVDQVADFCGPEPQLDDITLVVIRLL